MIPEFPLPPNEADFYRSKLYDRSPLFGVFIRFELPEPVTAHHESIFNPIDLTRPLKMAQIRSKQQLLIKTSNNRTFSQSKLSSCLSTLARNPAVS